MADIKMKDFLLQYFMQLRFNQMPAEVRAQYDAYAKNDDFRGNMKDWKKKLMHVDANGKLVQNDLPDATDVGGTWELSDDEWKDLFKAFQNAFRKMQAHREDFKENGPAKEFLDEYFGDPATHLFSNAVANTDAENEIQGEFKTFLQAYQNTLPTILKQWGLLDDKFKYSDLLSGISSKKYNKDPEFQQRLVQIADYLTSYQYDPDFRARLQLGNESIDFSKTREGFKDGAIPQQKMDSFKLNYQSMLNTIYREKKVSDVFKNFDGGKISGQMDKAKEKIAYDDKNSEDYVPPKRDDKLTPMQQLSRWADDTYDNVLDKYIKLHGDRLYMSNSAKLIVKAVSGAKIKPTDGLAKVLDSADAIKKGLMYKSPTATKHFEWFVKTMGELKASMPKAFEGALKNGGQLKAIVSEMIMKAVREGKKDEAKTAMEVLSVIKYGYTTSKIMDALRGESLTIFSDGGLSWNKNEGMQFVTKAMDKSIKFVFMSLGYAITVAGNAYKLNGSKFNHKGGRMDGAHKTWLRENAQARSDADNLRNQNNAMDVAARSTHEQDLTALDRGNGRINATNIEQKRDEVERERARHARSRARLDAARARPQFQQAETLVQEVDALNNQLTNADVQIQQINTNIANLTAQMAGAPAPMAQAIADRILQLQDDKNNLVAQRAPLDAAYRAKTGQVWHPTAPGATPAHGPAYDAAKLMLEDADNKKTRLDARVRATDRKADRVAKYDNATQQIQELNDRIDRRNEEMANWDDNHKDGYRELMAYWDFLESGRDSHLGRMYSWTPMSKQWKQKVFDKKKKGMMDKYVNNYQYS